jgi:acetyl coenzyme A synthetase (ADP forming)-like protein
MNYLSDFFAPKQIAVIGASRRDGSLGKMFLDAIVQLPYTGKVYPVNPKADFINDLKCYPDLVSLPEKPDLAVILLPKEFVPDTIDQLAEAGIKNVVVISAGFREVGGEGIEREKQLLEKIRAHGMRMVGPNSMGIFNMAPSIQLNATFSPTPPLAGHVGFISQSGALGVAVLELSARAGLGFSLFVSTGNKADITDVDVLRFLENDENTRVITLYQESIDDPARFREICSRIVPEKPVLVLKAGRTGSGLRAASSHTGALASDDVVADTFLRQCGVLRCDSLQELLDSARAMADQPLPAGNRVAVITNAGGPGILASDALEQAGLNLARLSEATITELRAFLPAEASVANPIDMIASADHDTYARAAEIISNDENIDALFVIIVKPPIASTAGKILSHLAPAVGTGRKPVLVTVMARDEDGSVSAAARELQVPVFDVPEAAARALGNMVRYRELRERFTAPESIPVSPKQSSKATLQADFLTVAQRLEEFNLPLTPYTVTADFDDLLVFAARHNSVALKIANPEIIHKSDSGLVKLGLEGADTIRRAFEDIRTRAAGLLPQGTPPLILAQNMARPGLELVLGGRRDENFGPVLMFGLGGVFVELFKDVSFAVLPLGPDDAGEMIRRIRGHKLLSGYRNYPAFDTTVLQTLIENVAAMFAKYDDITEFDLNPMIWAEGEKTPIIVDCRMTLAK